MEVELTNKERLDELELELRELPQEEYPLIHRFFPKLYLREIYFPANNVVISKIHKTIHPFIISKGSVMVKINDGEWERFDAPYSGTTLPNTRRVFFIISDCIWTTIHSNEDDEQDLEILEERIIQKNDNPLLQPLENKSEQIKISAV